jgi:hypothetical protein
VLSQLAKVRHGAVAQVRRVETVNHDYYGGFCHTQSLVAEVTSRGLP